MEKGFVQHQRGGICLTEELMYGGEEYSRGMRRVEWDGTRLGDEVDDWAGGCLAARSGTGDMPSFLVQENWHFDSDSKIKGTKDTQAGTPSSKLPYSPIMCVIP